MPVSRIDTQRLAVGARRLDPQDALARCLIRHGFHAVDHQVEHHLLELRLVCPHRQTRFQRLLDLHAVPDQLAVQQFDHLFDALGQVDVGIGRFLLLQHGAQAVDDRPGAFVVTHDVLKNLAYFLEVDLLMAEETQTLPGHC